MTTKQNAYEIVTQRILDALEEGVVPWQKPWKSVGGPRNLASKRPYRGINAFLLMLSPYSEPWWTTFKGAEKLGGNVKRGEKSTIVVFWKPLKVKDKDSEGKEVEKTIPLLRYYHVFNIEQCEGLEIPKTAEIEFEPILMAEDVLTNMPQKPETFFRGDRAFYRPSQDIVTLPPRGHFNSEEDFYTTAFHEYAHSTGHESRLHRVKDWSGFGSDPYSKEELVAEMTAAMICGQIGIEGTFDNSASYIGSWLKRLSDDRKLVIHAAAQAQKAADFIYKTNGHENGEES